MSSSDPLPIRIVFAGICACCIGGVLIWADIMKREKEDRDNDKIYAALVKDSGMLPRCGAEPLQENNGEADVQSMRVRLARRRDLLRPASGAGV